MLPTNERLTRRRDFEAAYARKRSWTGPLLTVNIRPHEEAGAETRRFGFVVSKKVSKAAHDRNRVKRRLGEICRLRGGAWRRGFDAVFVARGACVAATYADLDSAIGQLMWRAGCASDRTAKP